MEKPYLGRLDFRHKALFCTDVYARGRNDQQFLGEGCILHMWNDNDFMTVGRKKERKRKRERERVKESVRE